MLQVFMNLCKRHKATCFERIALGSPAVIYGLIPIMAINLKLGSCFLPLAQLEACVSLWLRVRKSSQ
jgi:hypothetical protein